MGGKVSIKEVRKEKTKDRRKEGRREGHTGYKGFLRLMNTVKHLRRNRAVMEQREEVREGGERGECA